MYPEELKKSISKGDIAPLYFYYGDNVRLIDEALQHITSALFPAPGSELDIKHYDAQAHEISEILQSVRTVPFFSEKKLVIVKNAQAYKDAQWKSFQGFFAKPSPQCCCIFVVLIDPKEKREKERAEAMKKHGAVVAFLNPQGKQIGPFIKAGLAKYGKDISPEALDYFVATVGEDAQAISGEIEKLASYCSGKKHISAADIDEVVSCGNKGTIFNMVDAIGLGHLEKSLLLLNSLLAAGIYPLVILKMIARQFRFICAAQERMSRGETSAPISRKLKLHEFVVKGLMQQARGWPAEHWGRIFDEIFQSDVLLKSSRIHKNIILENLIFKLAGLRNQPFA